MYNITKETQSESSYKSFGAGIYHNVELVNVAFASPRKDGNSPAQLIFNFKGSKGELFRHVEFEVNPEKSRDPEKSIGYLTSRVKHILCRFLPEEAVIFSGANWSEFCNGVIGLLGTSNVGVKASIKLVYDNNGNLGFPFFPDFISVDGSLKITSRDILVAPSQQPSSHDELDIAETVDTKELGEEDLLF